MDIFLTTSLWGLGTVISFYLLWDALFLIRTAEVGVIERFGKFARTVSPGLRIKWPFIEKLVSLESLRVQQLDVPVQTKTRDNVFVDTKISVQFQIPDREAVFDAYYRLTDPLEQIQAYVFDVVRAQIPKLELDDVFDKKDEIAGAVKSELQETMTQYGYKIKTALLTDIDPDAGVKESMNRINAAKRERMAAEELGEADRILKVKNAEADKESRILQGEGIAGMRKAIAEGLRESIESVTSEKDGVTAMDVIALLNFTNYTDMMKDIGLQSNTIMVPHVSGMKGGLESLFTNAYIKAGQTNAVSYGEEVEFETERISDPA